MVPKFEQIKFDFPGSKDQLVETQNDVTKTKVLQC